MGLRNLLADNADPKLEDLLREPANCACSERKILDIPLPLTWDVDFKYLIEKRNYGD